MASIPSERELLGAFALGRLADSDELAELDLELGRMDVRDVAARFLRLRDELSVDSAA